MCKYGASFGHAPAIPLRHRYEKFTHPGEKGVKGQQGQQNSITTYDFNSLTVLTVVLTLCRPLARVSTRVSTVRRRWR